MRYQLAYMNGKIEMVDDLDFIQIRRFLRSIRPERIGDFIVDWDREKKKLEYNPYYARFKGNVIVIISEEEEEVTVKIRLNKLKEAEDALKAVLTKKMAPKLAYRLERIADKINSVISDIEKKRYELMKHYGTIANGRITVPADKTKDFQTAYEKYLEAEVEMDIQLIPWECIEKGGVELSGLDMALLRPFMEIPPEEKQNVQTN